MAVPKSKITPSRRGQRRSHDKLTPTLVQANGNGNLARSHHMCLIDGTYKGRKIFIEKENKSIASDDYNESKVQTEILDAKKVVDAEIEESTSDKK